MIEKIDQSLELNDGRAMPGFGLGLYKSQGQELLDAMAAAFACGYRLYDTAAFYKNEETVGQALASLPETVFLVSKIWPAQFDQPLRALDESLRKLRRDYLDAYLLHWPGIDEKAMLKAWEALLREQEKGKIRSLGVSNFMASHLAAIYGRFAIWPAIDQIEIHPRFQQKDLCAFCRQKKIAVMAWSPLGRGSDFASTAIDQIAAEKGKTPAQIILRWHIQQDRIPVPKSVHAQRIRENADIFDFILDNAQMAAIDAMDQGVAGRRGADPMTFAG